MPSLRLQISELTCRARSRVHKARCSFEDSVEHCPHFWALLSSVELMYASVNSFDFDHLRASFHFMFSTC